MFAIAPVPYDVNTIGFKAVPLGQFPPHPDVPGPVHINEPNALLRPLAKISPLLKAIVSPALKNDVGS